MPSTRQRVIDRIVRDEVDQLRQLAIDNPDEFDAWADSLIRDGAESMGWSPTELRCLLETRGLA